MHDSSTDRVEPHHVSRVEATLTGALSAVGALMLAVFRSGRSFGYDEGFTYVFFIRGGSVERALTTQIVFNNHPMFSAIQAVAWRAGLVGERAQRLGPAVCGAIAVGLVAWAVARRGGAIAGAGAGVVLALNPVFLEQFRQLRGYALAAVAVLIAGVALWRSWSDTRVRWLVIQAIFMVVGVTTHAYSALTILMLAVASLVLGRVRWAHVVTWLVAACVALAVMSPLLDDMRRNASDRGTRFAPDFPTLLFRSLLGSAWPAVVITGSMVLLGVIAIGRRSARHAAALGASFALLAFAVFAVWFVIRPFDLFVRFFIALIPLIALLAGWGIARLPRMAQMAVVLALSVALAPRAGELLERDPRLRDAAVIIDRARADGADVCGYGAEPMVVYTEAMPLTTPALGFGDCDVFVSVLGLGSDGRAIALERFGGRFDVGGGVIVWAPPATLDRIAADD